MILGFISARVNYYISNRKGDVNNMTRQELESVYYLRKELRMWQNRREELEADIALSSNVADGMPHSVTNNITDPTQQKAVKLLECAKIIDGYIYRIKYQVNDIERFIGTIADSKLRIILELRCCQLNTWNEVSYKLGEGWTSEAVRQTYHRFVADLE